VELESWKLQHRLDIIEALLAAVDKWEGISDLIYGAEDRAEARELLQEPPFSFSEVQAEHILDMPAGRRTALGRRQLREERDRAARAIEERTDIDT
jgi:DNA gyrase subunit A